MRSHPPEWVLKFFNRKLEELIAKPLEDGFGLIHVLAAMDDEEFFPCNAMQVNTLGFIMLKRMETVPLKNPVETKDSMIGPYQHYVIQEGYEPPPLEDPGSPEETKGDVEQARQEARNVMTGLGVPSNMQKMFGQ